MRSHLFVPSRSRKYYKVDRRWKREEGSRCRLEKPFKSVRILGTPLSFNSVLPPRGFLKVKDTNEPGNS